METTKKRVVVRISTSSARRARAYAKEKKIPVGHAVDRIIKTGLDRRAAANRYERTHRR